MTRLTVFTFLLCLTITVSAQNRMSSADVSYLYNPEHEFLVDYRTAQDGNRVKVFLRFTLNSGMVKISDYNIRYDLRQDYIAERRTGSATRLDTSNIIGRGFREFFYAFELEKSDNQNLIVLEIENVIRRNKYYLDIPVSNTADIKNTPFLIFDEQGDMPIFARHVGNGTSVRIKNVFKDNGSFEINGAENNRAIALPPFDEVEIDPKEIVAIDTVYGALHDEVFTFNSEGFYTIIDAENKENVLGILVTDKFFPLFDDYKKMAEPLIYISTNAEYNDIRKSDDPKKGFEDFVLKSTNNNPLMASDFVKHYYRRVKTSGHLLTSTKRGWKTDKGMLYQIFGNPRQVFRNDTSELWVYAFNNGGRMRFIFDIKKGMGNTKEYVLIRGKKYRDVWMASVANWRNGRGSE